MNKIGYDHPHIVFYPDGTMQLVLQTPKDAQPGDFMDPNAAFAAAVYEHALEEGPTIKRWFCDNHPGATLKSIDTKEH